jgi:hypothetical protein
MTAPDQTQEPTIDAKGAFQSFESIGEAEVRARLVGQWSTMGTTAMLARLWLATKEAVRERERLATAAAQRTEEMGLMERSTKAAELAAEASERSARYTRAAAWTSALAAIAAAGAAAWPWIATVWQLPGAPK